MVLQYPIRLLPTALASADPVQLRRDSPEPVETYERALANLRPSLGNDAAAVVRFGAQALGLARSALRLPTDATAPELTDPDDINAQLPRSTDPTGTQAALANAIGPNVSAAALASALDPSAQAALLRTPGALDEQSGLFREPANTLESGFFRSPDAGSEFPRPLSNAAFESTFPRAPAANGTLESGFFRSATAESGFPRPLVDDTLESSFPRAPAANNTLESSFPRAPGADGASESGFFRPASLAAPAAFALAAQSSASLFPRAPVNATQEATRATITNAQSLFTGAPVAQIAPSSVRRSPASNTPEPVQALAPTTETRALRDALASTSDAPLPLSRTSADNADAPPFRAPLSPNSGSTLARFPATNPETAFVPASVANNLEPRLFRTRGRSGPESVGTSSTAGSDRAAASGERPPVRAEELSAQERRDLQNLTRTDRETRAQEAALRAAAGGYTRGSRVRYQMGPDGRRYIVEGQVTFDVTPVPGDPAATLRKMEVVSRAASAATNPSAADRAAAARAEQLMSQARAQLAAERYTEARQLIEREE
jgi:hypothetical protein